MYSALDHSTIVTDKNCEQNGIYILSIVEYGCNQILNSKESEAGFELGIVNSTRKMLSLSTTP